MLFWEALNSLRRRNPTARLSLPSALGARRLPYDKRCAAITKSGKRCRGRIREGSDYCFFHDPEVSAQQRQHNCSKGGRNRFRLSHLPDGYLRKLKSRASIAEAMDRLYREVRLGIVTPEMGSVLFSILTRMLDSGLADLSRGGEPPARRTRVDRIGPKLNELLTPSEHEAWRRAAANAPASFFRTSPEERAEAARRGELPSEGTAGKRALPAAS
jgi:hypothetical protein